VTEAITASDSDKVASNAVCSSFTANFGLYRSCASLWEHKLRIFDLSCISRTPLWRPLNGRPGWRMVGWS